MQSITGELINCSICKREVKKLPTHHLSYVPEITVKICWSCHYAIHHLARIPKKEQDIVIGWIKQYGSQWVDGKKKYFKSEHHKEYNKKYAKTDKFKEYRKEYETEKYFKKLGSEKMEEYIKNMERQVGLIN